MGARSRMRVRSGETGGAIVVDRRVGGETGMMRFDVHRDYDEMSRRGAEVIVGEVRRKPDLLLCAATGGTPTRTYELFGEQAREERGLFARLRVFKLDEWGGLEMDDPATCESYLRRHLIGPLGVSEDRCFGFRSNPADAGEECRRVEAMLEAVGPIDVCVLGLGVNGHLGFNEPAESLRPGTHVAALSESSMAHPMLGAAKGKVKYGLTLGIGGVMRSRSVLLLVNGAHKREAMRRLREGRVTTGFPASFLWLHGDVTCLCDRAAWGSDEDG